MTEINPTPTLRERQASLKQGYRDDPASAQLTTVVRSVTGSGQDPRRVKIAVDGPAGTVLEVGAHPAVGGDDDLPCSGDIFLASLAACQEITIRLVAAAMGLELRRLDLRVEGTWDVRGTLAVDREVPVGYSSIRIIAAIDTDAPQDQIDRLLKSAERYCVVSATLHTPPTLEFLPTTSRSAE